MTCGRSDHDIGLDTKALRFTCVKCGKAFNSDVAAGYLERYYDIDRWRKLNKLSVVWRKRKRQGVTLEPALATIESLEEIR